MLHLTTTPIGSSFSGLPVLDTLLEDMWPEGWMIRKAFARNFLLWRNGRIQTRTRQPVIVLPAHRAGLQARHYQAFLTGEVMRAVLRVEGLDSSSSVTHARLSAVVEALFPDRELHAPHMFEAVYLHAEQRMLATAH